MLTNLLNLFISQISQMYEEKKKEVDKLLSKILQFSKIQNSLPKKASLNYGVISSQKYHNYVISVAEDVAVLPFSKTFSNDLVPIVFPPNFREHEISILKDFDLITASPESSKFHDCIDIDTYSLKFKHAHYYFYRNTLVIDYPSGICIIDYDDLKTTKGMREISRNNFSWSGWYLGITSKLGGIEVDLTCKEEVVLEWLNTCFSLSVKDKSYTHEDITREITAEIERRNVEIEKRNAEIETEKADRRNRPDYYAALDWVAEKQEILSSSRRAVSSQRDQIERSQAQTKLYNTLSKLIEQTGKKQLKATGDARAVYDAFAAKLEELL
jgi:hypothetical protein